MRLKDDTGKTTRDRFGMHCRIWELFLSRYPGARILLVPVSQLPAALQLGLCLETRSEPLVVAAADSGF